MEIIELLPGVQFAFHLTGAKSLSSRLLAVYSRLAGPGTFHWFPGLYLPSRYSSPGISAERTISSLLCECQRPNSGCQACSACTFYQPQPLAGPVDFILNSMVGFPLVCEDMVSAGKQVVSVLRSWRLLFHRLWITTCKLPLLFHVPCDQRGKSDEGVPLAQSSH